MYPNDFKPFKGKRLSIEEIDNLVLHAEESMEGSVATGDILVESNEGSITVYQIIAQNS